MFEHPYFAMATIFLALLTFPAKAKSQTTPALKINEQSGIEDITDFQFAGTTLLAIKPSGFLWAPSGSVFGPSYSFSALSTGGLYTDGTNVLFGDTPVLFGNASVGFRTDNSYNIGNPTGNRPANVYAAGTIRAAGLETTSNILISGTAPTVATNACGNGTITVVPNGTAAFSVIVGTIGAATCSITLPTATNGWNCFAFDTTSPTTGGGFYIKQTGGTQTTATLQGYNTSGVGAAISAGDSLSVSCFAR